jgi:hypothetical protein
MGGAFFQTPFAQTALPVMLTVLIGVLVNKRAFDAAIRRFDEIDRRFDELVARVDRALSAR